MGSLEIRSQMLRYIPDIIISILEVRFDLIRSHVGGEHVHIVKRN